MRKTLVKNNPSKTRTVNTAKAKAGGAEKKNAPSEGTDRKKDTGNLMHILNYQYQDSDLEQFVF
jgi:hypothetical protein